MLSKEDRMRQRVNGCTEGGWVHASGLPGAWMNKTTHGLVSNVRCGLNNV
jgi:hypothetical protein